MLSTILYIDTTDNKETVVSLIINGEKKEYRETTAMGTKSQNTLPLIAKALKNEGIGLADIAEIKVNPGPGSFTGTRVGIAIANALGWALQIPVNGKKLALPRYEASKFD